MAAVGIPQTDIAKLVTNPATAAGIDPTTLRHHFRTELDAGAAKALFAVANNLFRIATSDRPGAVTAAIFILKTRAGWSTRAEGPVVTCTGADSASPALEALSDAELNAMFEQAVNNEADGGGVPT